MHVNCFSCIGLAENIRKEKESRALVSIATLNGGGCELSVTRTGYAISMIGKELIGKARITPREIRRYVPMESRSHAKWRLTISILMNPVLQLMKYLIIRCAVSPFSIQLHGWRRVATDVNDRAGSHPSESCTIYSAKLKHEEMHVTIHHILQTTSSPPYDAEDRSAERSCDRQMAWKT